MILKTMKRYLMLFALMAGSVATGNAAAVDVAGIKFEEAIRGTNNVDLKLNGAGIRYKAIFKVYAAGLYLKDKKTTVPEILATTGSRKVVIVLLRDIGQEEFGRGFMQGITQNSEKSEKLKLTSQFLRFGELFSSVAEVKKGDIMTAEWVPGVGTIVTLNGKKLGEPYPDIAFNNALLRIWLGEKPVDHQLKKAMLGETGDNSSNYRN